MIEKIILNTSDNIKIVGDYCGGSDDCGVLFLHMMPSTRESWRGLSGRFVERGWHTLSIDLRGHGESYGGPDGYKKFSDEEHKASIRDVEAGIDYLKKKGVFSNRITVIGASIGANLVLQCMAECGDIRQGVALSPGLNYRGIETLLFVEHLLLDQRIFFVSSKDDGENVNEVQALYDNVLDGLDKNILVYDNAGHGTDMLDCEEPYLDDEILKWCIGQIK